MKLKEEIERLAGEYDKLKVPAAVCVEVRDGRRSRRRPSCMFTRLL